MSCKIHKTPDWKLTGEQFKFSPINACCGTWMNCWSKWLDYHLQKLTIFIPSHIDDAIILLDWLKGIKNLPSYAFFFTSDANAMYNNIDTEHAICEIEAWLLELSSLPNFPNNFPLNAVIAAMKIIMRNNHFEFGDLNFLQLLGTAMGTSSACMWATIYFGIHENKKLLPK